MDNITILEIIDTLIFDIFTLIARAIIKAPNNTSELRGFCARTLLVR